MVRSTGTAATVSTPLFQEDVVRSRGARIALAVGRIFIGWLFFWPFLDKTLGLGFTTPSEQAWLRGGAPAQGYMSGIEGPFAGLFDIFINPFGDLLFMIGLLGIGAAMLLGILLRLAAVGGTLLMVFMWLSQFPPSLGGTNPIMTSHWLEAILLIISAATLAGDTAGLGRWWGRKVSNSWLR